MDRDVLLFMAAALFALGVIYLFYAMITITYYLVTKP